MPMDAFPETNEVLLRGTLAGRPAYSHTSRGQDFYSFPLRVLRLTKDCRLFLNGLDTLLDQLRQAGMGAEMETEKHPEGLNVTIRVRYG